MAKTFCSLAPIYILKFYTRNDFHCGNTLTRFIKEYDMDLNIGKIALMYPSQQEKARYCLHITDHAPDGVCALPLQAD